MIVDYSNYGITIITRRSINQIFWWKLKIIKIEFIMKFDMSHSATKKLLSVLSVEWKTKTYKEIISYPFF